MTARGGVPVTVVAGFLGAGKTTLMNDLLRGAGAVGLKLAVLVNDFGELNIDASLIAEVTDNIHALTNGCICCSMKGELINQIGMLATRADAPDHIVIECSGVSDPERIITTMGYPELREVARLDTVITVLDPTTLPDLEGDYATLARSQIANADLVAINKTDLVSPERIAAIRRDWLRGNYQIIETVNSHISPTLVFDAVPARAGGAHAGGSRAAIGPGHAVHAHSAPDHGFASWHVELPGTFRLGALRRMLQQVPNGVFRMKGQVTFAEKPGHWYWLHWVGGRTDFREARRGEIMRENVIVIITRRDAALEDQLSAAFQNCLAAAGSPSTSSSD